MPTTNLIDPVRLASIVGGSGETQGHILEAFSRSIEEDAASLHRAVMAHDLPRVEMLAHRIKGASVTFGATEHAEGCSLVSMACRSSDIGDLAASLDFFDRRSADLVAYIRLLQREVSPTLATKSADTPEQAPLCAGLRFMVVDDHRFQLALTVRQLQRLGAGAVTDFSDSTAAFEAMIDPRQTVDIVILDLSMPGMDGMDVMRTLSGASHSFSLIINSALAPSRVDSLLQRARRYKIRLLGAISKPLTQTGLAPLIAAYRAQSTPAGGEPGDAPTGTATRTD